MPKTFLKIVQNISDGQVVIVKRRYPQIQAEFTQKVFIAITALKAPLGECLCIGMNVGMMGRV